MKSSLGPPLCCMDSFMLGTSSRPLDSKPWYPHSLPSHELIEALVSQIHHAEIRRVSPYVVQGTGRASGTLVLDLFLN